MCRIRQTICVKRRFHVLHGAVVLRGQVKNKVKKVGNGSHTSAEQDRDRGVEAASILGGI